MASRRSGRPSGKATPIGRRTSAASPNYARTRRSCWRSSPQYGRPLTYLKDDFWKPYPQVRAREFARFLAFAKRGQPKASFAVPAGRDRGEYEKAFAQAELERSLRYCRDVLGLGRKR